MQNLKVEEDYKGLNWEAKRNKKDRIRALIIKNYPKAGDPEKYPNYDIIEAVITKEMVSAKLKKIRTQFKKAVDCGKKSGGGRFVFTFYTICQNIWGNSPAVTAIGNSVDSSYSGNGSSSMSHEEANSSAQLGGQDEFTESDTEATFEDSAKDEAHISSTQLQASSHREQAGEFLRDRRDKKLTTRVGPGTQLFQWAKEDLNLKRKMIEKMEKADEELNNNITKVSKTLDGIGEVMKQCVGILSNIAAPHMYNYHLQMPQGPYMTYLNESAINEQGTRQNEKL